MRVGFTAGALLACLLSSFAVASVRAENSPADLSTASLEDLTQMQISVSSFARKDEDLWKTPAAVFVITREDIAKSAATSIPELLRIVPGMQVAQIDASTWAISARGFNSAYADKLLVLVDGRTVYSEIYSGVPWDQIDLPLGDIERIEVIRGPGAAVWGTNAVNGVVNIITRRAHSTLGTRMQARIGRIDGATSIRYGSTLGDRAQYRGFVSYLNREALETSDGRRAFDGENVLRAGGRVDWQHTWADWITVSGDLYGGHLKQQTLSEIALPIGPNGEDTGSIAGGYLLSRWEHKLRGSDTALQFYFDDQSRHQLSAYGRTRTGDIDFQDHIVFGQRNDLVWGSEFRYTDDDIKAVIRPTLRSDYQNYLVDGFLQDEFSILPQRLIATVGTKLQDGTLAGFQVQPSVRLLWAITPLQSAWTAVSRAVVAPAIQDEGLQLPLVLGSYQGVPITGLLQGDPAFKPETVLAYEAGYRVRLTKDFSVDLASFININRRMKSISQTGLDFVPTPAPHIATEFLYTSSFRARTAGVEGALSWKPLESLSFQGSYTWMQARTVQVDSGNITLVDAWSTPRNSVAANGSWNFTSQWSANGFVSCVGPLSTGDAFSFPTLGSRNHLPAYVRLDAHLTRKIGRNVEFEAGGTNLLTPRHLEFGNGTDFIVPAYVPRSLFVNAAWSF